MVVSSLRSQFWSHLLVDMAPDHQSSSKPTLGTIAWSSLSVWNTGILVDLHNATEYPQCILLARKTVSIFKDEAQSLKSCVSVAHSESAGIGTFISWYLSLGPLPPDSLQPLSHYYYINGSWCSGHGGGRNQMPLCVLINAGRTKGPAWFSSSSLAHMWSSVEIMISGKLKTNVKEVIMR